MAGWSAPVGARKRKRTWRHLASLDPLENGPEVRWNLDRPAGGSVDDALQDADPRDAALARREHLVEQVGAARPPEHAATAAELFRGQRFGDVAAHHLAHTDHDPGRQHPPP